MISPSRTASGSPQATPGTKRKTRDEDRRRNPGDGDADNGEGLPEPEKNGRAEGENAASKGDDGGGKGNDGNSGGGPGYRAYTSAFASVKLGSFVHCEGRYKKVGGEAPDIDWFEMVNITAGKGIEACMKDLLKLAESAPIHVVERAVAFISTLCEAVDCDDGWDQIPDKVGEEFEKFRDLIHETGEKLYKTRQEKSAAALKANEAAGKAVDKPSEDGDKGGADGGKEATPAGTPKEGRAPTWDKIKAGLKPFSRAKSFDLFYRDLRATLTDNVGGNPHPRNIARALHEFVVEAANLSGEMAHRPWAEVNTAEALEAYVGAIKKCLNVGVGLSVAALEALIQGVPGGTPDEIFEHVRKHMLDAFDLDIAQSQAILKDPKTPKEAKKLIHTATMFINRSVDDSVQNVFSLVDSNGEPKDPVTYRNEVRAHLETRAGGTQARAVNKPVSGRVFAVGESAPVTDIPPEQWCTCGRAHPGECWKHMPRARTLSEFVVAATRRAEEKAAAKTKSEKHKPEPEAPRDAPRSSHRGGGGGGGRGGGRGGKRGRGGERHRGGGRIGAVHTTEDGGALGSNEWRVPVLDTQSGCTTAWLLDSGADFSIISAKQADDMQIGPRDIRSSDIRLETAVTDTNFGKVLTATRTLDILGVKVKHTLLIAENLAVNGIIGRDLLRKLGGHIDLTTEKYTLNGHTVAMVNAAALRMTPDARVARATAVPPGKHALSSSKCTQH